MFYVYGHRATQHADDNSDLASTDQRSAPPEVIYSTDDEAEAQQIVKQGGFVKDDVWHVAVRYDSTEPAPAKPTEVKIEEKPLAAIDPEKLPHGRGEPSVADEGTIPPKPSV